VISMPIVQHPFDFAIGPVNLTGTPDWTVRSSPAYAATRGWAHDSSTAAADAASKKRMGRSV